MQTEVLPFPCVHAWISSSLSCNLIPQHRWSYYTKWLISNVWKLLRKTSVMNLFRKVANLQCTDCDSTINRLHHRLFSEYVLKTSCHKKIFLRKISILCQHSNNVTALQRTARNFTKIVALVSPFWKSAGNSDEFTRKRLWWKLLFNKVAGFEFIVDKLSSCL